MNADSNCCISNRKLYETNVIALLYHVLTLNSIIHIDIVVNYNNTGKCTFQEDTPCNFLSNSPLK